MNDNIGATSTVNVVKQPSFVVCTKCKKKLLLIPKGGTRFVQIQGQCSCGWDCCDAARPANSLHPLHLSHTLATESEIKDWKGRVAQT